MLKYTLTPGLSIQTALAKALDQGRFVMMASLDLSSAFDVVNINITEGDSLTVSTLACHAADMGSNPARGDDFFN